MTLSSQSSVGRQCTKGDGHWTLPAFPSPLDQVSTPSEYISLSVTPVSGPEGERRRVHLDHDIPVSERGRPGHLDHAFSPWKFITRIYLSIIVHLSQTWHGGGQAASPP
jgi:hypothetical protein